VASYSNTVNFGGLGSSSFVTNSVNAANALLVEGNANTLTITNATVVMGGSSSYLAIGNAGATSNLVQILNDGTLNMMGASVNLQWSHSAYSTGKRSSR